MPGRRGRNQPKIDGPFQSRQTKKNQRLQGTTVPPDVGCGPSMLVVTGMIVKGGQVVY